MTNLNLLRYLRNLEWNNFLTSLDFFWSKSTQIKLNTCIYFDLLTDSELKIRAHFFLLNSYLSIFVSAEKSQNQNNNRNICEKYLKNSTVEEKSREIMVRKKSKNSAKGEEKPSQCSVKKNYPVPKKGETSKSVDENCPLLRKIFGPPRLARPPAKD